MLMQSVVQDAQIGSNGMQPSAGGGCDSRLMPQPAAKRCHQYELLDNCGGGSSVKRQCPVFNIESLLSRSQYATASSVMTPASASVAAPCLDGGSVTSTDQHAVAGHGSNEVSQLACGQQSLEVMVLQRISGPQVSFPWPLESSLDPRGSGCTI